MRKVLTLVLGGVLLGASANASAQEVFIRTTSEHAGYIGIRYDQTEMFPARDRSDRVVIREVSKGSPAEKAGLRAGDEILRINGLSPANGKFAAVARTLTQGDTVKLRIKRDGKERDYTVIAAARPEGYATMYGDRTWVFSADSVRELMKMYMDSARVHLDGLKLPKVYVHPGDSSFDIRIERWGNLLPHDSVKFGRDSVFERYVRALPGEMYHFDDFGPGPIIRSLELGNRAIAGAEFTDLEPAMKTYFGTDRGLLTLRVVPETPAARAGLQAGDVIVKANGQVVNKVSDLRRILLDRPETLKLEVLRNRETRTLEVPLQRKRTQD